MKNIILICLFTLIYGNLSGQNGEIYAFKLFQELTQCEINGTPIKDSITSQVKKQVVKEDWRFKIANQIGGKTVIRILPFTSGKGDTKEEREEDLKRLQCTYNHTTDRPIFFMIEENMLDVIAYVRKSRWDIAGGAITTPMKVRTAKKEPFEVNSIMVKRDMDILGEFNVGTALGPKFRFGKYRDKSINFLFGASIGGIAVDSTTTNGIITEEGTENLGVSFHGSLVLELKSFQIVFANGFDILGRDIGKNWTYQKGYWFGLGLGVNIFNTEFEGKNTGG